MVLKTECTPRGGVLESELNGALYTANFGRLIRDDEQAVYREPGLFFRNTFPMDALRSLCQRIFAPRSHPAEAGRFVRLPTGFGGGKTHALMVRHLANLSMGSQLLGSAVRPTAAHVVGIVAEGAGYAMFGNDGDQEVRSLAAELACQRAGASALKAVGCGLRHVV
jgi:hypothetical protein